MLGLILSAMAPMGALRPHLVVGRRAAVGALGATLIGPPRLAQAEDGVAPIFTKGDAFQLKASFNGLGDALNAWNVEIAQIQLGNEPSSVVAIAGFNDIQLSRLALVSTESAASVASFKKNRDVVLQNLYLARGAARYEKDPAVARNYIETARLAGAAAQSDLGAIAAAAGVDLARRRPAPPATPEDALTFTPRVAPKVENKLIF